jgi:hypothetical protein
MTGVITRERCNKPERDAIRKNSQSLHLKREAWLLDFDQEAHTQVVFDQIIGKLNANTDATGKAGITTNKTDSMPKVMETELLGVGQ